MGFGRDDRSRIDEREEMLAHIRLEADRLIEEEGLSEQNAMERARERFGYRDQIDPTDSRRHVGWLDMLARDVRLAIRQRLASPVSTAIVLASLVIGIGVNTAIFSIADQTLLRPLPVPEPDRIVQFSWEGQFIGEGRGWGSLLPHPLYLALLDEADDFTAIGARSPGEVTLIPPTGPERGGVSLVTGRFFDVMNIRPHLGRLIDQGDDRILGGHPVIVLSHDYWTSRFGADPDAIGREIRVNDTPLTIVGVAPEDFRGTDWSRVPVGWMPMMMNDLVHDWGDLDEPRVRFQHIYARLAPTAERTDVEAALQPWFRSYKSRDMQRADWPGDVEPSRVNAYLDARLALLPGGQGQAARSRELAEPVLILLAATALLLLLACLNVANLTLAQAVARYRDTAVRAALGASRARIMMERLVESALLAFAGAAAGILVAPLVAQWILDYVAVGGEAMALDAAISGRTLIIAAGIAVVATLLSGMGPAWFVSSTQPMGVLRTRSGGHGAGLRRALVTGQVGLALVLLMGAWLFGSTLSTLKGTGPGFETEQLVTFWVSPYADGYEREDSKRILGEVLEAASSIPGVERAGVGAWRILEGSGWGNAMLVEGRERLITPDYLPMNAVSPGFFDALGIDFVRGQDFTEADRTFGDEWRWEKAIVSESFVRRYLPGQEPLGVRIDFARDDGEPARMEIVGVVEDFSEQHIRDPLPQVYFPLWAQVRTNGAFYLRTRLTLAELRPLVAERIAEVDPILTVADFRTLDEQVDRLLVFERMLSSIGMAFALFGTLLAMIGVYGVLSFAVEARTREVGIRIALGAPRATASRLVIVDALRLAIFGIAVALPAIFFLGRFVESRLYGVSATSPVGLMMAVSALLVLCLAASAVPARRLARTDPMEAFRVE